MHQCVLNCLLEKILFVLLGKKIYIYGPICPLAFVIIYYFIEFHWVGLWHVNAEFCRKGVL